MIEKKPYTVLLAYPVWFCGGDTVETFLSHVEAANPHEAVLEARLDAMAENGWDEAPTEDLPLDKDELEPLAVFEGHHDDQFYGFM